MKKKSMILDLGYKGVGMGTITALVLLAIATPALGDFVGGARTYTTDADFDQGILNGLNHDVVHDQLQLNKTATTFPIMWIANAGEDTISKIDTKTGRELGRYRTWFGPAGQPGYVNHLGNAYAGAAPSRTAVDKDGNVYVANRHFDGGIVDVIKILASGGIDRNGNGIIDTSNDTNGNGIIDPSEILPLGDTNGNGKIDPSEIQDERIAWVVQVGPPNGLGRSLSIDPDGNIWVGLFNSRAYYKINSSDGSILAGPIDVSPNTPYGSLVDGNGTLWGASVDNTLLKLDTKTLTKKIYSHPNQDYGIAFGNNKVYMGCLSGCSFIQFDPVTETFSFPAAINYCTLGIAVDANGNIAVGKCSGGVTKFRPDGSVIWDKGPQPGAGEARGVQVDSDNNIWSINRPTDNISKYNGTDGAPLGVFPVGSQPYTYSDATGLELRTFILTGTWNVIDDSGSIGTKWGRVSWNDSVPVGASIEVKVRTAETMAGLQLATYQPVNNGIDFSATGRFIQIETRLTANPSKESPILYDLTVQPINIGSISGIKFNDLNGNGVKDSGEPGLANWTIILAAPNNTGLINQTTAPDGGYNFTNLTDGNYTVSEVIQPGWIQTAPAVSSTGTATYKVHISGGNAVTGKNFGNFKLGEIKGEKFNDVNGNGIKDAGDSGIPGWQINITGMDTLTGTSVSKTVTTGLNGSYDITGLTPGTYTVSEVMQTGYIQTAPGVSQSGAANYTVTITNSSTVITDKDFGNFQLGSVSGTKFKDLNANGVRDTGETGLAGWNITINGTDSITGTTVSQTTTTDANGSYNFTGLTAGTYTISEILKPGWVQTAPTNGTYLVNITGGAAISGKDFGNFELGSISGMKFNDINGNRIKDSGEPGLRNWQINLTGTDTITGTPVNLTTTTDASGNYSFTNLRAGIYVISEALQNGWVQTVPGVSSTGLATYTVNITTSGQVIAGQDFGNFKLGKVSGQKFEDLNANGVKDSGEVGLAGWQITITGKDTIENVQVTQATTTDANGSYNFSGLTAGTYTISETQQSGWVQTAPSGDTYTVIITSGSDITGQDFGNFHKGKITGGGWIRALGATAKATFGIVGQYPDNSATAQGDVEYQDHGPANLNVKSINISTVATTLDKKKGIITGFAQVNGAGSYPFVVYIEDNAEPGKGADVFRISLPTYQYSNGAILSDGNIQIHS